VISKKKRRPLVSIGIPIYNGENKKYNYSTNISKSINSILNQSYKNLEIIISDDFSSDQSDKIIRQFANVDKRIKYYKQKKNLGYAKNLSFVLRKSKGKYFKWNCQDDYISKDFIEKNLYFLEKNNNYSSSTSPWCFDYQNNYKKKLNQHDLDSNLYQRLKYFFKIRSHSHGLTYSLIRRRYLVNTTNISNDYLANDWIIDLELLFYGRFKTIKDGKMIIGSSGTSSEISYVKDKKFFKKRISFFIPYFDLNRIFLKKVYRSKNLNFVEKILICCISFKMNIAYYIFYYFKKNN
jgi:glycosyltransferase involved in cell wall biosynthesis